jgi:putative transposase
MWTFPGGISEVTSEMQRNLAAGMVLSRIDQLWIADITYIRLHLEFVYRAVLLGAFSRRCIGWALQRTLEAALAREALRMAVWRRRPKSGLVHPSDRGVQYASRDYTENSNNRVFASA